MAENNKENTSIKEILSTWSVTGKSIDGFYEELADYDARTIYEPYNLAEFSWISIRGGYNFPEWKIKALAKGRSLESTIKKTSIISDGTESEISAMIKEIEDVGGFLGKQVQKQDSVEEAEAYPLSSWAFNDLCDRAGISCANINRHSIYRDMWLVDNFTSKQITLVARRSKNSDLYKIFAIRGRIYAAEEQMPLIEGTQKFLEKDLGPANSLSWGISNEKINLLLSFPEKTKEIQEMYNDIGENIMPIVSITTSDVGQTSYTVKTGFRVFYKDKKSQFDIFLKNGTIKKKHDINLNLEKVQDEIKKKAYKEFIAIPNELARLLAIDIVDVPSAIDEIIDYTKLEKETGLKKFSIDIRKQLIEDLDFAKTAYDVVTAMLTIKDRAVFLNKDQTVRNIPESSYKKLDEHLSQSIFCPFESQKGKYILMPD